MADHVWIRYVGEEENSIIWCKNCGVHQVENPNPNCWPNMTDEEWTECWRIKHKFYKAVMDVMQEYIEEAEHQDGASYWNSYDSDDFLPDFARYIRGKYPEEFPLDGGLRP